MDQRFTLRFNGLTISQMARVIEAARATEGVIPIVEEERGFVRDPDAARYAVLASLDDKPRSEQEIVGIAHAWHGGCDFDVLRQALLNLRQFDKVTEIDGGFARKPEATASA